MTKRKDRKLSRVLKKKRKIIPDEYFTYDNLENVNKPEEEATDDISFHEEIEDNPTFVSEVETFKEKHKKSKLVKVYDYIGKPRIIKPKNKTQLNGEFNKLNTLLESKGVIVIFQNEYSIEEKFRFLTEEVLRQGIEELKNCNSHHTFIYEEFHPEKLFEDENEEEVE
ncbi:MAG: hypothetical protein ACP5P3_07045 [Ignavibacteria bacterium]